ncbi:TonB-dependent receptor [Brevundimonas sp. Leaf363]|uniref:TonB-dependent receptor n=1 Tax=Brevundimonas sp. Leaf363 TaxID=1736353 RepID=UPI0006F683CC|nr:TonB-dependent receptor [Brevundimonas sp. Leaf363]KQS53895.1 TonB-dependent receptor [Brevundimonas sp. Leaf363]
MKSVKLFSAVSLGALGAAMAISGAAQAQEATVEDIIVTATKRDESLRDTPLAISAITGEQLQAAGASSLADYIVRLPGVVFNDYQPGISEVIIRGVAATTYHEQGQTTVGYYINEVPVVEPGFPIGIPDVDTFDLQRVEVLRGPQGTLFGSSTLGGLVNYIVETADTGGFDAAAQAQVGSTKNSDGDANYALKAMVNVPIVADTLAVRLTANQRVDAGYLDNPGTGEMGSNDFRVSGLRGSAVYTPTPDTKVTFLSAYQETELDDQTYLDLNNPYIRNTPRAETQETSFWLNTLRLDQTLSFANLTVIASHNDKDNTTVLSYPYPYVTGVTSGDGAAYSVGVAEATIDTLEARLSSPGDGPFNWLVGVSYLKAEKSSRDRIYQQGAAAFIDANPVLYGGVSGSVLAPNDAIYGYFADSENEDFGIFGEVSWELTPQLELILGGRYYDTQNSATITNAAGSLFPGGISNEATFGQSQSENGFTPKVTLTYRPHDNLMVYGTYSEGYRVGGPNPNAAILDGIPESYESDTTKNYELGVRSATADGRYTFDVTVFHIDWENIQARLFTDAPYYYSYVTNAGGAEINGLELSTQVALTDDLSFHSNITYQEASLTEFLPDTFAVGGGYAAGSTLPGSSEWSIANNLTYAPSGWWGAPSFDLAHRYLSEAPVAFGNPNQRGGFDIFDIRAAVELTPSVKLLAFVNNVTDAYGVLNAPFTSQAVPAGSIVRPRTFGIRFDWSY